MLRRAASKSVSGRCRSSPLQRALVLHQKSPGLWSRRCTRSNQRRWSGQPTWKRRKKWRVFLRLSHGNSMTRLSMRNVFRSGEWHHTLGSTLERSILREKAGEEQTMSTKTRATIEDLYQVEGKAELVDGEIVLMPPAGDEPGRASVNTVISLHDYEKRTGIGRVYGDGTGFHVHLPHREAFGPDAAYHVGPRTGMRFLEGAPIFAVEIRSENDYGRSAEEKMTQKRVDYFAAGTLVVWDVDLLSADVVRVYRANTPDTPTIYRRGDMAEAEPAVAGWKMPVDALFL